MEPGSAGAGAAEDAAGDALLPDHHDEADHDAADEAAMEAEEEEKGHGKRARRAVPHVPTDQLGTSITQMVAERAQLKKNQDDIKRNLKALRARKTRMMRRAKNLTSADLMELARLKADNETASAAAAKAKAQARVHVNEQGDRARASA